MASDSFGTWVFPKGHRFFSLYLLVPVLAWLVFTGMAFGHPASLPSEASATILCYMNGDNDLSEEVLHALDMMETVGSSDNVNVIALVDGHEQFLGPYAPHWAKARMVRIETDSRIGVISSKVLEEWGEANLGKPDTLSTFIRKAMARYPADRYYFYAFAHSQGVIDTRRFSAPYEPGAKSISISEDTTSDANMSLVQFEEAVRRGLGTHRFNLMVLFSCLANMVEVGYALSNVTDYLVASEDEIRLLNRPSGSFQVRGLPFETIIAKLKEKPDTDSRLLGREVVDAHMADYDRDVAYTTKEGDEIVCRFSSGMSLIDTGAIPELVKDLDHLARILIRHSDDTDIIDAMERALNNTQRFASFLNLEYYDLKGFVQHLKRNQSSPDVAAACNAVLHGLENKTILYERHTPDCNATGLSVYLSNPLVPENIFLTHHVLYKANRFSRETQWDEMISIYRRRLRP